jgi:hypothetical protein
MVIPDAVKNLIGARVVLCSMKTRPTYDGGGFDIYCDFYVLWKRGEEWGTHAGCVHRPAGRSARADIYWGHYGKTEEEAREDYARRIRGL